MSKETVTESAFVPVPPAPMTASILMAYLEHMADFYSIEDQPVMIGNEEIVNAMIVDGRVTLMTFAEHLKANPPCADHIPVQHRDGKPPWCTNCKLTKDWKDPNG